MDAILQSQIELVIALQNIGGLASVMKLFTFLGDELFFLVLLPLVYLCFDAGVGARLAFVLFFGDALKHILKIAFHLPRPYWIDSRVQALSTETSYGLPSGHAQTATGVWFFLASALKKPWAWGAAGVVVLLISLSRIYLGVHFPMDIAGGWIIGGIFLWAFWQIEPRAKAWLSNLGLWGQIGAALLGALAIVLVGAVARAAVAGVVDPAAWASFAAEARSLDGLVTDAGSLFGVGVGLVMTNRWARFNAGGPIAKRAARFVLGMVCIGIVYFGLSAIFPRQPEALGLSLRFVRYSLATWVAIFAAPWLLLKLKLADSN